jgi:hypothetical protein
MSGSVAHAVDARVQDMRDRLARLADAELARRAAVCQAGHVPPESSPHIVASAPARGFSVPYRQTELVDRADGTIIERDANYLGLAAIRCGDAFDAAADAARRNGAASPFTPGQIAIGRQYATLAERCACAGVRCSSGEAMTGGGAGGGSFIDAVLRDSANLAGFHRRIGDGVAMELRRVRPSASGGSTRRLIRDRVLVDLFCVAGLSLVAILEKHHWTLGPNKARLRLALCAALDRMQGPAGGARTVASRDFAPLHPFGGAPACGPHSGSVQKRS